MVDGGGGVEGNEVSRLQIANLYAWIVNRECQNGVGSKRVLAAPWAPFQSLSVVNNGYHVPHFGLKVGDASVAVHDVPRQHLIRVGNW